MAEALSVERERKRHVEPSSSSRWNPQYDPAAFAIARGTKGGYEWLLAYIFPRVSFAGDLPAQEERPELKKWNKHANAGHFPSLSLRAECKRDEGARDGKKKHEGRGGGGFSFLSRFVLFSETATRSRMASKLDTVELLKSLNLSLIYSVFSEKIMHPNKVRNYEKMASLFRRVSNIVVSFSLFSFKGDFFGGALFDDRFFASIDTARLEACSRNGSK